MGREPYCEKRGWLIEGDSENPVSPALIGFPEWCPLPDVEIVGGGLSVDLKRVARQILKQLDLDLDDDSVISISHYLSTVVDVTYFKGAKKSGRRRPSACQNHNNCGEERKPEGHALIV
jgi:hypothetical protein